jgi:hypothetical protein
LIVVGFKPLENDLEEVCNILSYDVHRVARLGLPDMLQPLKFSISVAVDGAMPRVLEFSYATDRLLHDKRFGPLSQGIKARVLELLC